MSTTPIMSQTTATHIRLFNTSPSNHHAQNKLPRIPTDPNTKFNLESGEDKTFKN